MKNIIVFLIGFLFLTNVVNSQSVSDLNKIRSNTEKYIKKNDIKLKVQPTKVLPSFIECDSLNFNATVRLVCMKDLFNKYGIIKPTMFVDKTLRCYIYEGLVDINTFVLNNDKFLYIGKASDFIDGKMYTVIVFSKTKGFENSKYKIERTPLEPEIKIALENDTMIKGIFNKINEERRKRGLVEFELSYELCYESFRQLNTESCNYLYVTNFPDRNKVIKETVNYLFEEEKTDTRFVTQYKTGKPRTITSFSPSGGYKYKTELRSLLGLNSIGLSDEVLYDITIPKIGIAYTIYTPKGCSFINYYKITYNFDDNIVY